MGTGTEAAVKLRSSRTAIQVIHGVGEQAPYETLDSFTRGIFAYFQRRCGKDVSLSPIEVGHKDWTQVGMRIAFKNAECLGGAGEDGKAYIDVFEYYWAPATEGKYSAVQTVKWVLKTDFTPLRYFSDNLEQIQEAEGEATEQAWAEEQARGSGKDAKREKKGPASATRLLMRELRRVVIVFPVLGFCFAGLLWFLTNAKTYQGTATKLFSALGKMLTMKGAGVAVLHAVLLLLIYFTVQAMREVRQYPGRAVEVKGDSRWLRLNLGFSAVALLPVLWLDVFHYGAKFGAAWKLIREPQNLAALVSVALIAAISYALTGYAADVAIYTNMDAKSKDYETRNLILNGSTSALKLLLKDPAYDCVLIAAHSLGSVIAYDTINELLVEQSGVPDSGAVEKEKLRLPELLKLQGLLTFGCPLDKIYYFFREHVKRDQAVRAQVLSLLHSFRKRRSERDYGEFEFKYKLNWLDTNPAGRFRWINAWAKMDFISARLKFYYVDDQRQFHYPVPGAAHLSYWGDPAFYDYFCSKLVAVEPSMAAPEGTTEGKKGIVAVPA